jgi:hypothetical protein
MKVARDYLELGTGSEGGWKVAKRVMREWKWSKYIIYMYENAIMKPII